MRFTNTWSPISSVFSIELEGISKACITKVMMNSPVTSTAASEDRNSTVVSFGFSSVTLLSLFSVFANLIVRSDEFLPGPERLLLYLRFPYDFPTTSQLSVYQPESAIPAGNLKQVRNAISEMKELAGK